MDKNKIKEIREKLMKTNKPEEVKELLIQIKEAELEGITDHDEYAMKAAQIREERHQQMKHDAIKAANESEERFRKMQEMGNYKQEIKQIYETEEIKKHNR